MMRHLLFLLFPALLQGEMLPLFSGKDFTGWGGAGLDEHEGYEIEDGVIVATPKCKILSTDRNFTDYVLEFEFQLTEGANNGLGIHYAGAGDPAYHGMELQILDNTAEKYAGKLKPYQFHGSLYTLKPAEKGALKPVGEWNHQKVTVRAAQVTVELNGKKILEAELDELQAENPEHQGVARRSGKIAFCGHGDTIRLRNINLDEGVPVKKEAWYYPSGKPDPGLADLGFTTLFSGENLDAWKMEPGHEGHWTVEEDWILAYDGASEAGDKSLWTKGEFGDFQLVCDWRWAGPGGKKAQPLIDRETGEIRKGPDGKELRMEIEELDSGIYLRGSSKAQVNMWNWPVGSGEVYGYRTDKQQPAEVRAGVTPKATADNPIGAWNRFVITLQGEKLTVVLNGRVVIENATLPGIPDNGPLALQHHGSKLEFANIWLKKL